MGEGLYLFSVSFTLLVKDKPLRGAYASLTSVVDTLLLKQAISPSLCIVDATNRNGPRVAAFTGRLVHIHRTGGRILPDRWCWQNVICMGTSQDKCSNLATPKQIFIHCILLYSQNLSCSLCMLSTDYTYLSTVHQDNPKPYL